MLSQKKKKRGHADKSKTERSALQMEMDRYRANDPERVGMKEVTLKTERSRCK